MSTNTNLKRAGLKTTRPRLAVLEAMEKSTVRHMAAEDVYKFLLAKKKPIGLATIYRVLTQLQDAGLVIRHKFEGAGAVFELNDVEHHDHMVCVVCGQVFEFVDAKIESLQEKIARENGFEIHDHSLTLYGQCKKCKNK